MFKPKKLIAALAIAGMAGVSTGASAVVIDNGLASNQLGFWSVDVLGGGQTRSATVTALRADSNTLITSEVVYDYYTYLKIGNTGFQLSTDGATLVNGAVVSSGSVTGSNGNTIRWTSTSTIANSSTLLTNTFTFTSDSALGALSLFQYLDEDVEGAGNDVFFTRGTAVASNLELFTIDNVLGFGVSHGGAYAAAQGLVDAAFSGWAVDNYNDMKPRLANGTQTIAIDGVVESGLSACTNQYVGDCLGPVDVVSVLGWTVSADGTSATIVTTLGGLPDVRDIDDPDDDNNVPEPASGLLLGTALLGLAGLRRRR